MFLNLKFIAVAAILQTGNSSSPPTLTPSPQPSLMPTARCPTSYILYSNSCYKAYPNSNEVDTFLTANATCVESNSWLVAVNSEDENSFLNDTFFYLGRSYIGLTALYTDRVWYWTNGDTFDNSSFEFWAPGEPNDFLEEDCAEFNFLEGVAYPGSQPGWNDIDCADRMPFICEMSAENSPSSMPTMWPTNAPTISISPTTHPTALSSTSFVKPDDEQSLPTMVNDFCNADFFPFILSGVLIVSYGSWLYLTRYQISVRPNRNKKIVRLSLAVYGSSAFSLLTAVINLANVTRLLDGDFLYIGIFILLCYFLEGLSAINLLFKLFIFGNDSSDETKLLRSSLDADAMMSFPLLWSATYIMIMIDTPSIRLLPWHSTITSQRLRGFPSVYVYKKAMGAHLIQNMGLFVGTVTLVSISNRNVLTTVTAIFNGIMVLMTLLAVKTTLFATEMKDNTDLSDGIVDRRHTFSMGTTDHNKALVSSALSTKQIPHEI